MRRPTFRCLPRLPRLPRRREEREGRRARRPVKALMCRPLAVFSLLPALVTIVSISIQCSTWWVVFSVFSPPHPMRSPPVSPPSLRPSYTSRPFLKCPPLSSVCCRLSSSPSSPVVATTTISSIPINPIHRVSTFNRTPLFFPTTLLLTLLVPCPPWCCSRRLIQRCHARHPSKPQTDPSPRCPAPLLTPLFFFPPPFLRAPLQLISPPSGFGSGHGRGSDRRHWRCCELAAAFSTSSSRIRYIARNSTLNRTRNCTCSRRTRTATPH